MPIGLRMCDIAKVQGVHPVGSKATVADRAAVFDTLEGAGSAVGAGPGGMISGESIFPVNIILTLQHSGNPPLRDVLHVRRIRHVHDYQAVAGRTLVIFHDDLIVPTAIEIGILSTVVEVMMRASTLHAGTIFLEHIGLGGIGDVEGAYTPESVVRENFVVQLLVVLPVRILRHSSSEWLCHGGHRDPLLDL